MLDEKQTGNGAEAPDDPAPLPRRRIVYRILGYLFLGLALILVVYGAVVFAAWQRGQSLREDNARQSLQEELSNQLALARADVAKGSFNLARRRLEWVLERDAENAEALELIAALEAAQAQRLTPTPTATPRPTVAAEQATPADASEAAAGFADLAALMNDANWAQAVSAIPAYQSRFPGYRRMETDAMLYQAYINLGLSFVNGQQVELGLYYLEQAEKLGDLPIEVEDQRTWADLYLLGIGSFGVNWGRSIGYFRDLCAAAPFYQDACDWLFRAQVAYGDQYAAAGDFCPAADYYGEAWRQAGGESLAGKWDAAAEGCRQATPTPEPTMTPSEIITGTLTLESPTVEP